MMDPSRFDAVVQALYKAKTRRDLVSVFLAGIALTHRPIFARSSQLYDDCPGMCGFGETCRNGQCQCSGFNQTKCGYSCVSLDSDGNNCGGCGVSCGFGETCRNGQCQCSGSGQTKCGYVCANLSSDSNNCGGCGVSCSFGETCRSGQCQCSGFGQTKCGYVCTNLDSDSSNCGGCGVSCGFGESCRNGQCSSTSPPTSVPPAISEPSAPIPTPEALPEQQLGTPASITDAVAVETALRNFVDSVNSGNYGETASLMTENFLHNVLEVSTRDDVPALFEAAQPIDLRSVGNALSFADGRLSIDVVDMGLFRGTRQIGYERWMFLDEGGAYKLDDNVDLTFTESILPGAVVIPVQLVDFAFALSEYTVAADTPVIFRATNNSSGGYEHAIDLVTLPAATTAEQVIEGKLNPFEAVTEFVGGILVESGDTGDLALETLPRGTYFLICPMETPDGTPNFELGMVAEITVR